MAEKNKNQTAQERAAKRRLDADRPSGHLCQVDGTNIMKLDLQPVMFLYPKKIKFYHKECLKLAN